MQQLKLISTGRSSRAWDIEDSDGDAQLSTIRCSTKKHVECSHLFLLENVHKHIEHIQLDFWTRSMKEQRTFVVLHLGTHAGNTLTEEG